MNSLTSFVASDKPFDKETFRIDLSKRRFNGRFNSLRFIDKDTKQAVIYIPALEISGYGESFEKANEIVKFSVNEFCDYLSKLSQRQIENELHNLGWKKSFFNKQFSKSYIDINGQLQNLNAENNQVEQIALTAT